jgi:hypothetical protein
MQLTTKQLEDLHDEGKISDRAYNLIKPLIKKQPNLKEYGI